MYKYKGVMDICIYVHIYTYICIYTHIHNSFTSPYLKSIAASVTLSFPLPLSPSLTHTHPHPHTHPYTITPTHTQVPYDESLFEDAEGVGEKKQIKRKKRGEGGGEEQVAKEWFRLEEESFDRILLDPPCTALVSFLQILSFFFFKSCVLRWNFEGSSVRYRVHMFILPMGWLQLVGSIKL